MYNVATVSDLLIKFSNRASETASFKNKTDY